MNPIFAAALEIQTVCRAQDWQFCFIGGVAVQRWGQPRFTVDVDLTLLTSFSHEETFVRHLLQHFRSRRPDAAEFALRYRVLLLASQEGIPLDVALGAFPFEVNSVRRASPFRLPEGQELLTCSAEDLVVHKCFANREKDWLDVETILARQGGRLDLDLIRSELVPLLELKGEPDNLLRLEKLLARLAQPLTTVTLTHPHRQP